MGHPMLVDSCGIQALRKRYEPQVLRLRCATLRVTVFWRTLAGRIGDMVRKATLPEAETTPRRLMRAPNGLLIAAPSGRVLTPEMVKAAQEDEIE